MNLGARRADLPVPTRAGMTLEHSTKDCGR